MKVTAKDYAKALYMGCKDKSKNDIDQFIGNFIVHLARHNKTNLLKSIFEQLKRHIKSEEKIADITINHTATIDAKILDELKNSLKKRFGDESLINEKVDNNLLGGIVLQIDDKLIDGSFSKKLNNLKEKLLA